MAHHHRRPVAIVLLGLGVVAVAGCGHGAARPDGTTSPAPAPALAPAAASGLVWADEQRPAVDVAPPVGPSSDGVQTIVVTIGSPTR